MSHLFDPLTRTQMFDVPPAPTFNDGKFDLLRTVLEGLVLWDSSGSGDL